MLRYQTALPRYRVTNYVSGVNIITVVRGLFKLLLAFAVSLRLSLLPHSMFRDRENYLWTIDNSSRGLELLFDSSVPFLLNEPLFKIANSLLSICFSSDVVLSLYVFINCFVVLCFVLYNRGPILYSLLAFSLLLLIPYFYGGVLGAVRQGLGFNFVLLSLITSKKITDKTVICAFAVASLFHVMFYIFLVLVLAYRFLRLVCVDDKIVLFIMLLLVVVLGFSWGGVTPYLSSSQSYQDFDSSNSGLTFIGWASIFIIFLYNYIRMKTNGVVVNDALFTLVLMMFFCFLVFYWLAPGPYRLLYSCTPLLVCAVLSHFNVYSAICYGAVFIYSAILLWVGSGAGSMNVEFGSFVKTVFFG